MLTLDNTVLSNTGLVGSRLTGMPSPVSYPSRLSLEVWPVFTCSAGTLRTSQA